MEIKEGLIQSQEQSTPEENESIEKKMQRESPVKIKVVQKPVPTTPRGVLAE